MYPMILFFCPQGNPVEKLKCFLSSLWVTTERILSACNPPISSSTSPTNVNRNNMLSNFINTKNSNKYYQQLAANGRSLQQEMTNNRRWGSYY